jgi:hypothetical protein
VDNFGDVQFTVRTRDSALFVNPLMAIYFTFRLDGLAQQVLYLDRLENTVGMRQVATWIERFGRVFVPGYQRFLALTIKARIMRTWPDAR